MTNLEKNLHLIPESSLPFLDLRGPFALVFFFFFFMFKSPKIYDITRTKKNPKKNLCLFSLYNFLFLAIPSCFMGSIERNVAGRGDMAWTESPMNGASCAGTRTGLEKETHLASFQHLSVQMVSSPQGPQQHPPGLHLTLKGLSHTPQPTSPQPGSCLGLGLS